MKFGHASVPREGKRSARMSTKTTKRKRAVASEAPAVPQVVSAAVELRNEDASVSAGDSLATSSPVSTRDSLATSSPVSTRDSLTTLSPVVSLFSNSTVKDAAALQGTLLQVIDSPGTVAIDAKSVERIDTAVLQVLCAFIRDRAGRNLSVEWRDAPQPLLDAARLLGLEAVLALPSQAMGV
jgi:ABC-type transporter Mla MlaB component